MKSGPVVVGISGTALTAVDRERLAHPLVGMVILFAANYESPQQLARLTDEIHALREPALLIAVDHEGGRVQRFRDGFTALPAMRRLGECWDRDVLDACRLAASAGYVLAAELRAHGVDFSFAPVLDIDHGRSAVIGDRAFHSDPRVVTLLAAQVMHGMALAGMANCGKHFPGHGWAAADSHLALPLDERGKAAILADAQPYHWLGPLLTSVMPAHLVYRAIDKKPAGFSRRWIRDWLRSDFGFTGAVFSDDLLMAGAASEGSVLDRADAALTAGCDYALVCNDLEAMDEVLDGLKWVADNSFVERAARLRPRGPAPGINELRQTALYRSALADIERLQDTERQEP